MIDMPYHISHSHLLRHHPHTLHHHGNHSSHHSGLTTSTTNHNSLVAASLASGSNGVSPGNPPSYVSETLSAGGGSLTGANMPGALTPTYQYIEEHSASMSPGSQPTGPGSIPSDVLGVSMVPLGDMTGLSTPLYHVDPHYAHISESEFSQQQRPIGATSSSARTKRSSVHSRLEHKN